MRERASSAGKRHHSASVPMALAHFSPRESRSPSGGSCEMCRSPKTTRSVSPCCCPVSCPDSSGGVGLGQGSGLEGLGSMVSGSGFGVEVLGCRVDPCGVSWERDISPRTCIAEEDAVSLPGYCGYQGPPCVGEASPLNLDGGKCQWQRCVQGYLHLQENAPP